MVDQAEIHRKAVSGAVEKRREAAEQLRSNFAELPDKKEAWKDLIRLTGDENSSVRSSATYALGSAFQYVPDKEEAWKDLHKMTGDENSSVRSSATYALGSAFQYVPNKEEAWKDLHRMTGDENRIVRSNAAYALGSAFQHIPDKEEAWKDLHRLTDEEHCVLIGVAYALGSAFQYIPVREEAWKDLIRLTGDEANFMRALANYSLGRASIFKATEAESEEDFENELKNALDFFEASSKDATYYVNPSSFCLPFYRSFYTIAFEKAGAEGEVQRYLAEAKNASEGSKNKEILLEAIENLANALSEAHKVTDFEATRYNLAACRRYCDRAADLICDAEGGAPGAAGILRRGLPIINERICEIQERAEALCRETRGTGTPYESLGTEVNKWARDLSDRGYLRGEKDVSRIRDLLGKFCDLISEDERDYPYKIVEEIREEREPEENLSDVATALSYLVPSVKSRLQNAAKPMTDEMRSDEQPSQKIGPITTVLAEKGSNVTVNTAAYKESQPDKQPDRSSKRTAIEISADIAVHVLVYTVLHHFAEDIMPVIAPILVLSALTILLLIIRNAKS